jgi:long-chain acyl-CoA synthetase
MNYRNLIELHRRQAERLGPLTALRFKRHGLYHDLSWEQYRQESLFAAAGLIDAGVNIGDRVGLVAENRVEWLVADMAILTAGAVNVPPHAPLTAKQVQFELADAGVAWVIVSTSAQLDKVLQVRDELPLVRGIVAFDVAKPQAGVIPWETFVQHARLTLARLAGELERREKQIGLDDLATIMYTSGTTGNPKGVMLTHGNLLSNAIASLEVSPHHPDDLVLSWLPFSHIYARTCDHYTSIVGGRCVALAESAETVVDNLADVQPTIMASVPRLYEKVLAAVACPDKQKMGRRLRDVFGPRIDWLSSGGAPLPLAVAQAYHECGLLLLQGYGLTESSPVISFNNKTHHKLGTVGRPLPGVEVRIAADGEILTRGPHVMKGYWHNPAATAEAIRDGWLYTGDLGALDADGYLSITGRKKELLVMSNGKKVVPSHIEGLLQTDPCIDQAVVCGEGRNFLAALLVPHWGNVQALLQAEGTTLSSEDGRRTTQPEVLQLLESRVKKALCDLSPMEQVKKFLVIPQPFSVAAEELTVSLKLRRNVVLGRYAKQIDGMYREQCQAAPHPGTSFAQR